MSRYNTREQYRTSNIFTVPSWLSSIMIILVLVFLFVLMLSGITGGEVDPFKITTISKIELSNDNPKETLTVKQATENLYDYKDMPYDYRKELEDTYTTVSGKFEPVQVSGSQETRYVFTSKEYDATIAEDSATATIVYTTNHVDNIKAITKGKAIKFKGKLETISVTNTTRKFDDGSTKQYNKYVFYVSNIEEKKDGDR
jgi:hypothetical protein